MKVTAGLIWSYALDLNIVTRNIAENLYIGKHKTTTRLPLTPEDLEKIKGAIGKLRYAEYIYCQCYLGFRPGEFLEITKEQVKISYIHDEPMYYIVKGIKTEAGIDRSDVIPKQILGYILKQLWIPGTNFLFPFYFFERNKENFVEFRRMKMNYYAESVFKPIAQELGIEGKVPYSARHTYADKLKHAAGDERDKAALIGHTDYDFTRRQYQSSPLEGLKAVIDTYRPATDHWRFPSLDKQNGIGLKALNYKAFNNTERYRSGHNGAHPLRTWKPWKNKASFLYKKISQKFRINA